MSYLDSEFIMFVTTRSLDHHGIVSGIYDELEIGKVIDEVLPKLGQHKLAHSIVVKAMILNCLGFTDSRLYKYSQYFETLPVERLLGSGISTSDLTDDVLGRTMHSTVGLSQMKKVACDAIQSIASCRTYRKQVLLYESTVSKKSAFCSSAFAVLDGVDVDSGTAWEIGYAYARGKPIIGLRTDFMSL